MKRITSLLAHHAQAAAVFGSRQRAEKHTCLSSRCLTAEIKTNTAPPPSRPAQPDTYMITLAGAGSLLGRTGRGRGGGGGGRGGGGGDSWRSNSRGAAGGRGGGEVRRCSSRQPGLLTDLTRGQRGGSLQRAAVTYVINQITSSNLQPAAPSAAEQQSVRVFKDT